MDLSSDCHTRITVTTTYKELSISKTVDYEVIDMVRIKTLYRIKNSNIEEIERAVQEQNENGNR